MTGHPTRPPRNERLEVLRKAVAERILVLDGSWGTAVQDLRLDEDGFAGERFAEHPVSMKGNTDILCLTRPDAIAELLDRYFAAGADIVSTNTFTSTRVAQADYQAEHLVTELNHEAARLGREAADRATAADPSRPRWVAGAIGPTNRALSLSPDVNDPGARAATFDEIYDGYREQIVALNEGDVDLLLIETIFDTLNAKAAIKVVLDLRDEGVDVPPIWISGTITDRSGRTLSGQTVEAFWTSVAHAEPFAVGLNCALGADLMRPHIAQLARVADTLISAHPNAGLPNEFGEYDETPAHTSGQLGEWARSGLVNIVGGCCGCTPAHIHALAEAVDGVAPRELPEIEPRLRLSGLEQFVAA